MKKTIEIFIILYLLTSNKGITQPSLFDTVSNRIFADMETDGVNLNAVEKNVFHNLDVLPANFSWNDINYYATDRTNWSPVQHLKRVKEFALVYANVKSKLYKMGYLYNSIVNTLRVWNKMDPRCDNWWYNEIESPQLLGQIMIIMRHSGPLPRQLEDSLVQKMKRGDMYKQSGANKSDVALHCIYRAVLTQDAVLMDSAVNQSFLTIDLTTGLGLQYDYSYLLHGRQLQIASYGVPFLVDGLKAASYVQGTPWQIPEEKRKILLNYCNNVFLKTIRGGYFDFSVKGRGFTRKETAVVGKVAGDFSGSNKNYREEIRADNFMMVQDYRTYQEVTHRIFGTKPSYYPAEPTHTHFWEGDYTLHVRPGYLFSVRTNSIRTCRTETGNGENLYGRYMSDGATDIQCRGDEYDNIFPLWEFDKIPGVTCRDYATDRPAVNSWEQPGTTGFVGGVSDSLYGASVYDMNYDSVKAKKSWFFFDREIVCLGAGIQSNTDEKITTAVNQCRSNGKVMVKDAKTAWWHDSIGYYFRPGSDVSLSNDEQSGTWYHINTSQPKDTVRGKVFKLWLNHGDHPQKADYCYIVVPALSKRLFLQFSPYAQVKIISNTDTLQAVEQVKLNILQAVFYKAGTLKTGQLSVSVDEPCVLMIKNAHTVEPVLFIADPGHKLNSITVVINGKTRNCLLPQNVYAGSTVKYTFRN